MNNGTILVVDDDLHMRELYGVALTEAGYRVVQAADGQSAVDAFHAHAADLVLLDIGLGPNSIDGLEVCRRLRRVTQKPMCC